MSTLMIYVTQNIVITVLLYLSPPSGQDWLVLTHHTMGHLISSGRANNNFFCHRYYPTYFSLSNYLIKFFFIFFISQSCSLCPAQLCSPDFCGKSFAYTVLKN